MSDITVSADTSPNSPGGMPSPPNIPAVPQGTPLQGPNMTVPVGGGPVDPNAVAPHQSWFTTMAHSVAGAVLGVAAAREKEIAPPSVAADGTMQPAVTTRATTGDQLRQMARSALTGLAAGARIQQQKSGVATALAGLGAGADDAIQRGQDKDLLERKQAGDDFERQQQMKLSQAANAHTAIETMKLARDLQNQDLETGMRFASMGNDALQAATAGGNEIVGQNIPAAELSKFRDEHPDYLKYTPILTKVAPQEGAQPDPKTGEIPNERFYSFIDYSKPVEINQSMIDHLKTVGFPGADNLQAGQKVDGKQFQGLWWQGLKMYNEANMDPKNKEVVDSTDPQGNPIKVLFNKATNVTQTLRDPDTNKPLSGTLKTETRDIYDPNSQQTGQWIVNTQNGKKIAYVGPSKADMTAPVGDYSLSGDAFIQTLPPPMRDTVKKITSYDVAPEALGRSQDRKNYIDAATHYDPAFDEKNYKLRYDYLRNYQSSSTGDGASRSRLNTATSHLDMLAGAAKALANNDIRFFNQVANEFGFQVGTSPRVAYDTIARKAAGEAAGAIKGGAAATEPEIESVYKTLDSSNSPAQQHSAIQSNLGLLKTQADTIEGNFKSAMGKSSDDFGRPVLFPQNKAIMQKWTSPQNGQGGAQAHDVIIGGKIVGRSYDGGKTMIPAQAGQ